MSLEGLNVPSLEEDRGGQRGQNSINSYINFVRRNLDSRQPRQRRSYLKEDDKLQNITGSIANKGSNLAMANNNTNDEAADAEHDISTLVETKIVHLQSDNPKEKLFSITLLLFDKLRFAI